MFKTYNDYLNALNSTLMIVLDDESDMLVAQQLAEAALRDQLDATLSYLFNVKQPLDTNARRNLVAHWRRSTSNLKISVYDNALEPELRDHDHATQGAVFLIQLRKLMRVLLS